MFYIFMSTDGIAARKLQQESAFGEWLDIVIDLFTRSILWCFSYPIFGYIIFGFEFLLFVCIHSSGHAWQGKTKQQLNSYAAKTISNGFKTVPGFFAIVGLWILPLWCYVRTHEFQLQLFCPLFSLSHSTCNLYEMYFFIFLILCRLHCCFVELCVLKSHIVMLLEKSTEKP